MDPLIKDLLAEHIYLGTSSWKYAGWKGLIYNQKYASEKRFNDECLKEYAEHYPAVGVDHTFYAWPTAPTFTKYVEQTPAAFRFGLKATERSTIFRYPKMKRYGKEAGNLNPHFLDPQVFKDEFLRPLDPFKERLGPIMLEFSQFFPGTIASGSDFTAKLDHFFAALKDESGFQFAIELRNANWLKPPYFAMLLKHKVAHVFNSWTRMPALSDQLELTKEIKFPLYVSRLLLRPGVQYEKAVEAYSPYDKVQDEQPELREAAAALVNRARDFGVPAYVFVNNRCEGSAPYTIEAILKRLKSRDSS
jgi:uncharacterized protein YecE (DUF72 family)